MIRVLVVEDDFMVAKVHCRVVERVPGFAVVGCAHNGSQAVEQVMADPPDLVILDMYLPDVGGLEVLRRIRGAGLGVDVVVISAAKEAETVREALRGGAVDYLLKPFRVERLVQCLEEYREQREQVAGTGDLVQDEIDRMLGRIPRASVAAAPKGIDPTTLTHIRQAVATAVHGMTDDQVAAATGVSRSTAHRYLRHLTALGEVRAEPVYGSVGRPELVYRKE